MVKCSLVPRLCPAFLRLRYELQVTESWAVPGNEVRSNALTNWAIGAPTLEQRIDGIYPEMKIWLMAACELRQQNLFKTEDTNADCFHPASHIRMYAGKIEHQRFSSLLGEKASRRLHATLLATCRQSSYLRDVSSTSQHTSTSSMHVQSSLV